MGLLDFLRKNEKKRETIPVWPVTLGAAAEGNTVPMEEIPDQIFSAGILGKCVGIEPEIGAVYAPIDGKIIQVAETLHAVGIASREGIEMLIHIGLDTVDMKGEGFSSLVRAEQEVKKGQILLTMDIEKIRAAGHPAIVITAITNMGEFASVEIIASGTITHGEPLLLIKKEE